MKNLEYSNLTGNYIMQNNRSTIYEYDDKLYKIFSHFYLYILKQHGINIEEKLLYADKLTDLKEISMPTAIIYHEGEVVGYEMEKYEGTTYDQIPYDSNYTLMDFANLYSRLEEVLNKANDRNIVIPDFASCDNILFLNGDRTNIQDNEIRILDYSDFQIGEHKTFIISTGINCDVIKTPKYYDKQKGLYKKELNKLSLVIAFFSDALFMNLKLASEFSYNCNINGSSYKLVDLLRLLGIEDSIIIKEMEKLYNQDISNPNYSDIFYRIAELYRFTEYDKEDKLLTYKLTRK